MKIAIFCLLILSAQRSFADPLEEACGKQTEAFESGYLKAGAPFLHPESPNLKVVCEHKKGKRTRFIVSEKGKVITSGFFSGSTKVGRWVQNGKASAFLGKELSAPQTECDPVFKDKALVVVFCPKKTDLRAMSNDISSWAKELAPLMTVNVFEPASGSPETDEAFLNLPQKFDKLNLATFSFSVDGLTLQQFQCRIGTKMGDCLGRISRHP